VRWFSEPPSTGVVSRGASPAERVEHARRLKGSRAPQSAGGAR
jgi:hypothetical protein